MDNPTLRILIRDKLADGRLPHDHIPRMWGGPGNGETCDGCGETVTKTQMLMEGLTKDSGAQSSGVQFHITASTCGTSSVRCWGMTRAAPPSSSRRARLTSGTPAAPAASSA